MGTLTADSLQGIRGKSAHLGLGSEFIETNHGVNFYGQFFVAFVWNPR